MGKEKDFLLGSNTILHKFAPGFLFLFQLELSQRRGKLPKSSASFTQQTVPANGEICRRDISGSFGRRIS